MSGDAPSEIWQPGSHVLEAKMLHLDPAAREALHALFEKLERQQRLVHRQSLTDTLDEESIVGRNAES